MTLVGAKSNTESELFDAHWYDSSRWLSQYFPVMASCVTVACDFQMRSMAGVCGLAGARAQHANVCVSLSLFLSLDRSVCAVWVHVNAHVRQGVSARGSPQNSSKTSMRSCANRARHRCWQPLPRSRMMGHLFTTTLLKASFHKRSPSSRVRWAPRSKQPRLGVLSHGMFGTGRIILVLHGKSGSSFQTNNQ